MSNSDQDITKLKDELKKAYITIENVLKERDLLLKERETLKEMYNMQIEMVRGMEKIIDKVISQ